MKLFRREPGDRSPAAADLSGYRPKETDTFEFRRPALERSDEATIANLISLFREGDEGDAGTPVEEEALPADPDVDAVDDAAAHTADMAAEPIDEDDGGALWADDPAPEAAFAPVTPAAAAPDHGAVDRLRARLGEATESDWADPSLMAPAPTEARAAPAAAPPAADGMPDLSAPLLLKGAAPDDAPSPARDAPADGGAAPVDVPMAAAAARPARRGGRVKTRLLGFEQSHATTDPFAKAQGEASAEQAAEARFPVGWIVVLKGPGRGACFTLFSGVSQIGRGEDQNVRLDFGDTSISRQGHAVVAYDPEQRKHFLGHGGKANIVRLNDMPVLSTEELRQGDLIRLGETTLRFVALCGDGFDWDADGDANGEAAGDEFAAQ